MKRVLVPEFIAETGKRYLREKGYEVCDSLLTSQAELIKVVGEFDGWIVREIPCDDAALRAADRLKAVSKHGVGFDNIDVAGCTGRGIQATYTPEAVGLSVAEHAIYLILACAKNAMFSTINFVGKGNFEARNERMGVELEGSTAGILGLGRIGRLLAKKCEGLGMKVIAYDPLFAPGQTEGSVLCLSRDEVIQSADFLCMCLPNNSETRGGFGEKEFAMMKPSAYFINIARGQLIKEAALIEALRSGGIRGAGIDVYETEPPDPDNPLLHMDNVMATPHQAGATDKTADKVSLHAAIGIDEALSGRKPSWPLNHVI